MTRSWIGRVAASVAVILLSLPSIAFDFGGSDPVGDSGIHDVVLAVAQVEPTLDKQQNLLRIEALLAEAAAVEVDLIVFPELAATAYPWVLTATVMDYVQGNAETLAEGETVALMKSAAATYGMTICWGMIERSADGTALYNSLVTVGRDGEVLAVYRKIHLVPGVEEALFTPGDALDVFPTEIGLAGMMICYDRRFPELARTYALLGAELLLVGAATSDAQVDEHILATRAYENASWLLFANQVGMPPSGVGQPLHGGSRIVDPEGRTRAEALTEGSELVWVRVAAAEWAADRGLLENRRPEAYADSSAILWASRSEAQSLVEEALFPEGNPTGSARYILPAVVAADEEILDWDGVVHQLLEPAWFVFIDDQPGANWGHPCRYVFVDALSRELLVLHGDAPPRRLVEMEPF
jgi:predicted amidohydrolase